MVQQAWQRQKAVDKVMLTKVAMKRMVFVVTVPSYKHDSYSRTVVYKSGRVTSYVLAASGPDLSRENLHPVIPAIFFKQDSLSPPPNKVDSRNSRTFRLLGKPTVWQVNFSSSRVVVVVVVVVVAVAVVVVGLLLGLVVIVAL